jgi:predicted nucleic acid-binding protein
MVLETAVNGQANAIVTHNVSDFQPESERFGIPILTPRTIIKKRIRK